ncbi:MAG TPA: methyltransferase domain-containing protein [Allosphingosinicella sp.]
MAITWGEAELLIYLARENVIKGRVATFGRMTMLVNGKDVKELAKRLDGYTPAVAQLPDGDIDDQAFFAALGVASLTSIDAMDVDRPTMIADLSRPLPEKLHGSFDAVLDSGTMEHVANFASCLQNSCRLVKVGGYVVHSIPSTNFLDHGYFSVSPIFYVDFFEVNRWRRHFLALYGTIWTKTNAERTYWSYTPEVFGQAEWTGQFNRPMSVASVAQRTPESTYSFEGVIQREYKPVAAAADGSAATKIERIRSFGKALAKSNPGLASLGAQFWYWWIARHTLAKTRFRLASAPALLSD